MIEEVVARYLRLYPDEFDRTAALRAQFKEGGALNDRKNFTGHITGGAFILSPDKTKLLVIYHKLFDKWLQPGGHWEGDEVGPWTAARREAEEETGVRIARQIITDSTDERIPFYIESHVIKNRPQKKEPAHLHHDFKYVFLAGSEQLHIRSKEVNIMEAEWVKLDDPRLGHMGMKLVKLQKIIASL